LKIVPSATNNNLSFGSIVYLVSGYVILFKGNKIARFYVLAWSIYIVGGLMATLRNSGALPHNFWTTHMVEIGAATETFLLALALSDKYRKIRQDAHNLLEQKVQERTVELQERNEELTTLNEEIRQQSEEIMAQRDALEYAYSRIENQNTDIFDSLEYAKRIQDALLPMRERIEAYFADFLLLHQPKDIVSGDFYWFATVDSWKQPTVEHDGLSLSLTDLEIKRNKIAFLAVVDCTGHGVPGAFMTMIGGGLLEQIVRRDKIYSPAQILKELDARLLRTFQQRSSEEQVQDGMDISLLQIDLTHKKLVWASAKRPLWIAEKGRQEFTIYKGDKYPIGGNQFTHKIFTEQEINMQEGDVLYTFSDGYADQFGEKGKYTVRRFKELLLENRFKTLKTQEMLLHNHTQAWRGSESQTDDILVIGLKF
jgi:serine phosphatase RsbU (regulator of sigma subunit)